MTTFPPSSRLPGRLPQLAGLVLASALGLCALGACDFKPLEPSDLEYSLAPMNREALTNTWPDIAAGAEAQVLGALEMLVGTPSAPRFLLTESMMDDGWDPNLPFDDSVGELKDEVKEEIRWDNRARRFEDQLRLIREGRYQAVPKPLYADDLWDLWESEYLPALLEDPEAPFDPEDTELGSWQENALALFENWYPTLAESAEMYRVQCLHCHGPSGGGDGPTSPWLNPRPRDYRHGKFKWVAVDRNQRPRREDLYHILHYGVPRTAMPSFARFSRGQLEGLIDYVRLLAIRGEVESLMVNDIINSDYGDLPATSALDNYELVWGRWQSGPETYRYYEGGEVPRPDQVTAEMLAHGEELFHGPVAACSTCHGEFGRGDGESSRETIEVDGQTVVRKKLDEWGDALERASGGRLPEEVAKHFASNPRNLQLGNYRGGGRPVDLYRRVKYGISGTIMPAASSELTDEDIWSLVYYVRSLAAEHDPARIQERRREQLALAEENEIHEEHGSHEGPDEDASHKEEAEHGGL